MQTGATNVSITPLRVVVMENESELRTGLQVLLSMTPKFEGVKSFGSMKEALRTSDIETADLVLTDLGLPRMNCIEGT